MFYELYYFMNYTYNQHFLVWSAILDGFYELVAIHYRIAFSPKDTCNAALKCMISPSPRANYTLQPVSVVKVRSVG